MERKIQVKQEIIENIKDSLERNPRPLQQVTLIDLSSGDSDSGDSSSDSDEGDGLLGKRSRVVSGGEGSSNNNNNNNEKKKRRLDDSDVVLPLGFLDPLPSRNNAIVPLHVNGSGNVGVDVVADGPKCKQFWKAGDYEGVSRGDWDKPTGGMDHVRVHPKFLHSNATSHKWVLGAFAELLDNSLDEVCNGATYVSIDMIKNKKDGTRMLVIEDNGGGMDPDQMRQCMSLGYSVKSKIADTIGQYGNGFKTSTMRLGADVIVFSRCPGKDGRRPTQSIGLLSYTFLRSTGKEDIVVPMLDYESRGQEWNKMIRSSAGDWNLNVETIVQWSPFSSEADLLRQFNQMKEQGTRIIIYNLWEDDQGQLELDFDTDLHDIQIRGVNRDEKNIQMAKQFPNSRHFLTYRHSLRSYASILYLRIAPGFRIILRGKDVEHHNVVNDMMMTQEVKYRPQAGADVNLKDPNMVAEVTIGFVKDAKAHIDVQGFNVYHKNRLIKPFWRLWNAAGSDGRGVIGVLEANFVEPAHDKQGFERTIVLSRLEAKLVQMQKTYWSMNCHKIGYAPRRHKNSLDDREASSDYTAETSSQLKKGSATTSIKAVVLGSGKFSSRSSLKQKGSGYEKHGKTLGKSHGNGSLHKERDNGWKSPTKFGKGKISTESPSSSDNASDDCMQPAIPDGQATEDSGGRAVSGIARFASKADDVNGTECSPSNSNSSTLDQLREENRELKDRLKRKEEEILGDLLHDLQIERDKCKSLETQLKEATQKIEELNKEQETIINIFSEERERRDFEEENMRKKLKDASTAIQELLEKVRLLEKMRTPIRK